MRNGYSNGLTDEQYAQIRAETKQIEDPYPTLSIADKASMKSGDAVQFLLPRCWATKQLEE